MSPASGQWDDLLPRILSGAVLAGLGLATIWLGGIAFHIFVVLACGAMIWELSRMLGIGRASPWIAVASGAALFAAIELPGGFALPFVLAPALIGISQLEHKRLSFAIYLVAIQIAGFGLAVLRDDFGFVWMAWLALVVIATDIGGYFAGRAIGGPKIWPRISPKKTWSGTAAGWTAAAAISIPFITEEGAGYEIIGIAVAVSMASQLGDVSESALKRRAAVKDSSSLIPGHGGLLDRFDSMLGASLFLLLVEQIVDFPPVPGV
jgi:phosphatidate cytidylyltransferase